MSDGWVPGGFTVPDPRGPLVIAGWIKGVFALDFRPFHWSLWDTIPDQSMPALWVVTHIPTGHGVLAVADSLDMAKAIVAELDALIDWSKVTLDSAKWLERRVFDLGARYPFLIYRSVDSICPTMVRVVDA